MAATFQSGPMISTGNLDPNVIRDPDIGPDMSYQGSGIIDPRFVANIGAAPGYKVYGYYTSPYLAMIDAIPQAYNATCLAGGATVAVTTAVTAANAAGLGAGYISANLATSVTGSAPGSGNVAINIPFCPTTAALIAANVITVPVVLEMGYGFGGNIATTTSGSATLTLASAANSKFFRVGQKICVAGAKSSGQPLLTTVTAVSGASVTMADKAGVTLSSGTQVASMDPNGLSIFPAMTAGCVAMLDPVQSLARGLRIVSSNAGDTGFKLIVRGYDVDMQPMTETLSFNGTTVVYGKKAWKAITQIYLWNATSATTAGNISIGTSDVFGLSMRSDFWEYMNVFWNQTFQTAAPGGSGNGWTVADTTLPATGTTGDIKGTLQMGANGGGTYSFTTSPNGSIRLAAFMSLPPYNALNATNLDSSTLFGVAQYGG